MATVKQTMKAARAALRTPARIAPSAKIRVGVDLGTAFSVIMVTDEAGTPLAGATKFADVVRDGIVWDFAGAQAIIRELRQQVESATGRTLTSAAVTIPPAVGKADHRAHRYVIEGAGMDCT
ncbi:MAG: ethanolamine utilization protein EutJ, partial [Propionibacteriaceae bacterium]|nr:ethanolamine utilization protein EutJ [Propionibacteriaceae bacterium]